MEDMLLQIRCSLASRLGRRGNKRENIEQFLALESHPRQKRIESRQSWFTLTPFV